jgi:hypothetical protein
MPGYFAKAILLTLTLALVVGTSADAQSRRRRAPREVERPAPAVPIDKRDSVVAAPGASSGRPYWVALAQCGGIYFKLNLFYTDAAVHARAVKPDPKANAEYTRMLTEAIKTASTYFNAAEHFLMTDRGIERTEAVLTYDGQSRAAGDRVKSIAEGLAAAKACPALYEACQQVHPKECDETLSPTS